MKIVKLKKEKDKYKIYLDNSQTIETYEDILLENNLLLKKELTDDELDKIINKNTSAEICHKLQKLIGVKYRSEKWIKNYLEKKLELKQPEKDQILDKLKQTNFIDDERYAKAYIIGV